MPNLQDRTAAPGCNRIAAGAANAAEVAQDLRRRLQLAVRIAERTLQFLGKDGFDGAEVPDGNFAAEKPLAETAMLLYVAARYAPDVGTAAPLRDLVPYARSEQMRWDVVRYPSVCLQLATPHILLSALGHADPGFDELLARSWSASARAGHEVVPYRELEVLWLDALWRSERPGPVCEEIARRTALGNPIDLLNGTRDDAYAHTHAPMYATNFGAWQVTLPRPSGEFLDEAGSVLARALVVEDYDLAGEALMAWPLLSSHWSPAAAFGFRVLASLEDKVGFLPAGRSASGRIQRLNGHDKTRCALATSYHTAYVMGMLCAVSLRDGMASPFDIAGAAYQMDIIEMLYAAIPRTGAHWENVFQSLDAREQMALAPFLLDVALIRSSRSGDAARMVHLLQTAIAHGMANTAVCSQSAEYLSRLGAMVDGRHAVSRLSRA
ncbi:DUF6895 family protein [Bradyrhizobium sp. BR 10261]|uniref:DUF6895 family protein n=1 Tax=Bradyrhizobium sp. BR 10261 TaxID=2749992 RepID=UPI001C650B58|nr:hypothetical protein [Bradyrhizobium sp. BR 10261]MBW7964515.1 hypothetical protein [Bradyrhizobium sp. BR 10261]